MSMPLLPTWLEQTVGIDNDDDGESAEVPGPARSRSSRARRSSASARSNGGSSIDKMEQVRQLLARLALTDVSITLMGETGTGKGVLARAVHDQSARAQGPFVAFRCGAVAGYLGECELFGHEPGASTALVAQAGAIERADGGTLFLDELGELPLELQPRLQRTLVDRLLQRVGGSQARHVDVRVVSASTSDLKVLLKAGLFRQGLYLCLATALVEVPPLRECLQEIPRLVPRLLEALGRPGLAVAPAVYDELRSRPWLGNVGELKSVLACALPAVNGGVLELQHLPLLARADEASLLERLPLAGQTLERIERAAIKQTLLHTNGNKALAAQHLGIAVSTLYEKLKKYGV